jgi:signal transduction histidine kinase
VKDWFASVDIPARSRIVNLKTEPDGKVATDMFWVMQKLLTSVARPAGASEVQVSLSGGVTELKLQVQVNGHGFDPAQVTQGFGLMGVRERVRQHVGLVQLESSACGTVVRVSMKHRTTP